MRDKRTFIKCARLLPYQRNCRSCPHRNCALRDNQYPINFTEEHAYADFADDRRQGITESFVLNAEEAI